MEGSVLLVDDEPNITLALKRALRSEGLKIFIAHSGEEALSFLAEQTVDLVVSDHRMPGINGADLLGKMRGMYPDTVRIMLTGEADMAAVSRAVNEGSIYKFLTKPWDNEHLRSIVREAIDVAHAHQRNNTSAAATLCQSIQHLHGCRVFLLEIRNAVVVRLLSDERRSLLYGEIENRCRSQLGTLHHELVPLEDNLLALVTDPVDEGSIRAFAAALAQPIHFEDQIVPLRIAAGYSDATATSSAEEWIHEAKIALAATSFAGDITPYSGDIQYRLHQRHSLENDMRTGLKRGEFFLALQPQVRGTDLAIQGAEGLCRWTHPERGPISPMQFIDLAEETGFIHELGAWVIQETGRILEILRARKQTNLKISFNVSPRQFSLHGWTDPVFELLQACQLEPGRLEVEITESTVMDNPELALKTMTELKAAGVCLALDDFGTGHSSLSLVNELPIDVLKFDRSLVKNIATDNRSRTLFTRLVEMTHELGLDSIAEGVENTEQVAICQELGCTSIQGFAFYKPMSVADFMVLLNGGSHEQ